MKTEKLRVAKDKETLLIGLHCRVLDNRSPQPILGDGTVERVAEHIDFDFEQLKIRDDDAVGLMARAEQLDMWTSEFVAKHPDAVVLNLGCGLDSRVFRLTPPPGVLLYDVDFP